MKMIELGSASLQVLHAVNSSRAIARYEALPRYETLPRCEALPTKPETERKMRFGPYS